MEINYELETEDLILYSKQAARESPTHEPLTFIFGFFSLCFLFTDFIFAIFFGFPGTITINWLILILVFRLVILTLCLGLVLLIVRFFQLRLGNKIAGIEENGLLCQHKIVLNEKELIEITNVNNSRHSWNSIAKIEENEAFVLITIATSATYFIPKRFFQDGKHVKKFLETARHYRQNASHIFQPSYLTEYEKSLL
jgi:asparagine N-glycosylation enzyme membrane subunit Stt3